MNWMQNRALWIGAAAIALYWLMDAALGTELTRYGADILMVSFGTANSVRLSYPTWRAFREGAKRPEQMVIISWFVMWSGIAALGAWGFQVKIDERPTWMLDSPINGFLRYWIVCAAIMALRATTYPSATPLGSRWLFRLLLVFAAGIFVGLATFRFLTQAGVSP